MSDTTNVPATVKVRGLHRRIVKILMEDDGSFVPEGDFMGAICDRLWNEPDPRARQVVTVAKACRQLRKDGWVRLVTDGDDRIKEVHSDVRLTSALRKARREGSSTETKTSRSSPARDTESRANAARVASVRDTRNVRAQDPGRDNPDSAQRGSRRIVSLNDTRFAGGTFKWG